MKNLILILLTSFFLIPICSAQMEVQFLNTQGNYNGIPALYVGIGCAKEVCEMSLANYDAPTHTSFTILIKPSGTLFSQNFYSINLGGIGYKSIINNKVIYKHFDAPTEDPILVSVDVQSIDIGSSSPSIEVYIFPDEPNNPSNLDPVAAANPNHFIYLEPVFVASGVQGPFEARINTGKGLLLQNISVSQAIAQNLLKPLAVSMTTNLAQGVSIEGNLTVDTDYVFNGYNVGGFTGNSILTMGFDAKIIVKSGKKLTLKNTTLIGCNDPWRSIYVEPGGTLIVDKSQVYDATYGVQATAGSEVYIASSYFEDNVYGVYQESNSTNVGIVETTFRGKAVLKSDPLKPSGGIKAEENALVNCTSSTFTNMYKGIDGYNAIITQMIASLIIWQCFLMTKGTALPYLMT